MTEIIKTNNTEMFKVLIYGSDTNYIVVDMAYITKGLYQATRVHLYPKDHTLSKIKTNIRKLYPITENKHLIYVAIENINKCRLIDAELTIKP